MSIGIAFATGALKGWTSTKRAMLDTEKAKKAAEVANQRFYEEQFFELAGKEDANPSVLSALAKKTGMTDIDIANTVNKVGSTFGYNQLQFPKPYKTWTEDISRLQDKTKAGGTWLTTYNNISADITQQDRMINHFSQNPEDLQAFKNDVQMYSALYIDGQRLNKVTGSVESEYIHPEDQFKNLFTFMNKLQPAIKGEPNAANQVTETAYSTLIENEVTLGLINNPENAFVFSFLTVDGKTKNDAYEFADQTDIDAVGRLATNLGYGGDRKGIQTLITNYSDIGRASSTEEAFDSLLSAVEMEKLGYGMLSKTLGGDQVMNQQFSQYIKDEFGGDHRAAIQAYAPLIKLKEDKVPVVAGIPKRTVMKPPEDYFKNNGLKRAKVIDQYEANQTALRQLAKLNELLQQDNTPTGLKAAMQAVGFGIFGEGGQLSQFFGSFETEDGTDEKTLTEVAVRAGFLSKESAMNLSVIDSLKLSLAAQMARAVDPSGRLSNQDFEIQLRRLGQTGLFTSKPQATAGLSQVIDDFETNSRRLQVLYEVAQVDATEFGKREIRVLKADSVIRRIEYANYTNTSPRTTTDNSTGEEPKDNLVLDPSGYYTDGQGNFYTDKDGTKPAAAEDVLKAMGMGP